MDGLRNLVREMSVDELRWQSHDDDVDGDGESWLRLDEAADRLGLPRPSVERLLGQRILVGRPSAGGVIIREADLDVFRAQRVARQREALDELRAVEELLDRI